MPDSQRISVRVKPRSSKDEVVSWEADRRQLTVRVTAPPVNNAANEATIMLISKSIKVPKSRIRVVIGSKSRDKILEIDADASRLKLLKPS